MGKQASLVKKNTRQSNIELLRIIAMIMIIAHHIAVHSGFGFPTDSISVNRLWVQFIQMGGKIGVNIFVLISGYFSVTAKSVRINKVFNLWLQLFTYSVGIFLVFILVSPQLFSIELLVKNAMPITFSQWWFASVYFVLYLLSPFINVLLNSFDKKMYQRFLVLLFLCWCIVPTLFSKYFQSNSLLWFVFLYALAGYIRLYIDINSIKSYKYILVAIAVMFLTYLSVVVFDIIGLKIELVAQHATYLYDGQRLPAFIISLMFFVGFLNIKIGCIPFVNVISASCFGIYLIHDNRLIRNFLWSKLFQNSSFQDSELLILYTIMQIVVVFVVCSIIELLRIHLIERLYSKPVNKLSDLVSKIIEKLFSLRIFEKV